MRALTVTLEDGCFGPWKGALLGLHEHELGRQRLHDATLKVMGMLAGTKTSGLSSASPLYPYVQALVDGAQWLTDTQLDAALMYLMGWTESMRATDSEVAALRQGRRPADCQQLQRIRAEVHRHAEPNAAPRSPVILLLSSHLQSLPWEAMAVLSDAAVSRMPSWLFLLRHLPPLPQFRECRAECLHSPLPPTLSSSTRSADLPTTEATFTRVLPALQLTNGTTGLSPTPASFLASLSSDLFLYLGHGSGVQYIPSSLVEAKASPGVALLMGCSSGRLKGSQSRVRRLGVGDGADGGRREGGRREPVGRDGHGEIDRFAIKALELITGRSASRKEERRRTDEKVGKAVAGKGKALAKGKEKASMAKAESVVESVASGDVQTISEVVRDSRAACKLRYLMGASPVVFGMPVAFDR